MKILVIGGSSGLGFECSRQLALAGHIVIAASRRGVAPDGCTPLIFDLSQYRQDGVLLELLLKDIDALLIAGGMGAFYGPHQLTASKLDDMVATNERGPILLLNNYLIARRLSHLPGKAIAVTSTAVHRPAHGLGLYAATKGAVEAWIRAEGPHQAEHANIRMCSLALPWFTSPMTTGIKPEIMKRAVRSCFAGRFADLSEVGCFTNYMLFKEFTPGATYFYEPSKDGKFNEDYFRFLTKITLDESGCWLWTGTLHHGGYGVFKVKGKMKPAHRWLYEQLTGSSVEIWPSGQLHHKCHTRLCVNPWHLELVDPKTHVTREGPERTTKILASEGHKAIVARLRSRTHCKNGHVFTNENTYWTPSGHRACRTCDISQQGCYHG